MSEKIDQYNATIDYFNNIDFAVIGKNTKYQSLRHGVILIQIL